VLSKPANAWAADGPPPILARVTWLTRTTAFRRARLATARAQRAPVTTMAEMPASAGLLTDGVEVPAPPPPDRSARAPARRTKSGGNAKTTIAPVIAPCK
jgi:hypothetical protein